MKAMRLHALGAIGDGPDPLTLEDVPDPAPGPGEVLVAVGVCGVCHTELDEVEGRTPPPALPAILGHEVVGRVVARGAGAARLEVGARVGVAWIHSACGECPRCAAGAENLCDAFRATGRDAPGGYAELMTVPEAFAHPIPAGLVDARAAPLMCAGAIGYRSLRLAGVSNGARLGLTGFGASGHLVLSLVRHEQPATEVYVFARSPRERAFACELGAVWAGDTADAPPERLHAVIDTTPAWRPVVAALAVLEPGGRLVVNAIRKEAGDQDELLRLDYARHLWLEKEVKSVANVTRADVRAMLDVAAAAGIAPTVEELPLAEANRALREVKAGHLRGAKVLRIGREPTPRA